MTLDEAKRDFDTIIDLQPTVEAEPIVRCKDCKFNYGNEHNCEYNHHDLVCTYWESDGMDDDDFCSCGAMMDEQTDYHIENDGTYRGGE